MADENSESNERTQDPTPLRLEEALNRGDVVKSIEVNTWFTMAGGTLAMMIFAVPMASSPKRRSAVCSRDLIRSPPMGRD
jgi:flagellar biosynthesis protein FlhB